jgi:hypothetical protein
LAKTSIEINQSVFNASLGGRSFDLPLSISPKFGAVVEQAAVRVKALIHLLNCRHSGASPRDLMHASLTNTGSS